MRWATAAGRERPGARAPLRRRGAAEELDRHLRRRDRRPIRRRTALVRRRQSPARARRPDLDAPQGHAERRRDDRGDRPARGDRGDRPRSAITGPLDSIEYDFVQSGPRIHKTVHYFLMEPTGGDLADHDHEFDEVRWIRFEEAPVRS